MPASRRREPSGYYKIRRIAECTRQLTLSGSRQKIDELKLRPRYEGPYEGRVSRRAETA